MDQTLDPRLQLDEGAVVGDVGDAALEAALDRVLGLDAFPGVGFQLLHAQADALGLGVEADDLDGDGLADLQRFRGMVDAAPRDVGDVQQAIDATEIDERAVIGDVLDHALENLAFLEVGHQLRAGLGAALFEHRPARNHDVAARAVHLENLERLRRAEQRRNVANGANVDLRARQEGHRAREVDGEAALDPAEDDAGNPGLIGEGLFQQRPGFLALGLLAAEHGFAVLVFHALEIDLDGVAGLEFERDPRNDEFLERNPAFGLEADVDQHLIAFDRNDPTLDDGAFQAVAGAEGFLEHGCEAFAKAFVFAAFRIYLSHRISLG